MVLLELSWFSRWLWTCLAPCFISSSLRCRVVPSGHLKVRIYMPVKSRRELKRTCLESPEGQSCERADRSSSSTGRYAIGFSRVQQCPCSAGGQQTDDPSCTADSSCATCGQVACYWHISWRLTLFCPRCLGTLNPPCQCQQPLLLLVLLPAPRAGWAEDGINTVLGSSGLGAVGLLTISVSIYLPCMFLGLLRGIVCILAFLQEKNM